MSERDGSTKTANEANETCIAEEGCCERSSDDETIHSADQDGSDLIPHVEAPLNVFRNQIIFSQSDNFSEMSAHEQPHPKFYRHFISAKNLDHALIKNALKEKLNPNVINGIKIPEDKLGILQSVFLENFSKYKIRVTQRRVEDVANENRKLLLIEKEHNRAHRAPRENKEQLLEQYYFPQMMAYIKKFVKTCEVCNSNKYDRHPTSPELQSTPTPRYPCEILHMDIMEIQNEKFITVIDKFSKFCKFFRIKEKSSIYIRSKLIKILHFFTVPQVLVTDNERGFLSPIILNFIKSLGVKLYLTPSYRSEVNGQIERVHSTVLEIYRCLKTEYSQLSVHELIYVAVDRYNNTIHSVIKRKPSDIFFNRSQRVNYQNLLNIRSKINRDLRGIIKRNMDARNVRQNKKRVQPRKYNRGEVVFVAMKGIKGKAKPLFRREVVARDNRVTITTESGKKIHKAHLKNITK